MKALLAMLFIFSTFSVAFAQDFLISPKESRHDLEQRIYRLERAVRELQDKVWHLSRAETTTTVKNNYFCKLEVFGKTYKAFGPSKLEASEKAKDLCSDAHGGGSSIHCSTPSCEEIK